MPRACTRSVKSMTSAIMRFAAASVFTRVMSWPVGARTISIWMPGKRSEKRLETVCAERFRGIQIEIVRAPTGQLITRDLDLDAGKTFGEAPRNRLLGLKKVCGVENDL